MTSMHTPNPIVGYRLKPGYYSVDVQVLKTHGPDSKKAGEVYETTLAYCRNLEAACIWLFTHIQRSHGETADSALKVADAALANAQILLDATRHAQAQTMAAVAELTARLEAEGVILRRVANS